MGLLKLLGLSTKHEGQHATGKHTKKSTHKSKGGKGSGKQQSK
jgi:hypothetical protein